MSVRRDPYEGSLVASTFLALGAYAVRYADSADASLIAALGFQQIPLDEGIGDNMLRVADRYVLIEFKRSRRDLGAERRKTQRIAFLRALREKPDLRTVSDISHFLAFGEGHKLQNDTKRTIVAVSPCRHIIEDGGGTKAKLADVRGVPFREYSLAGFARGILRINPEKLRTDLESIQGFPVSEADTSPDGASYTNKLRKASQLTNVDAACAVEDLGATPEDFANYLALLVSTLPNESFPDVEEGNDSGSEARSGETGSGERPAKLTKREKSGTPTA
jgi:hypothetical protein